MSDVPMMGQVLGWVGLCLAMATFVQPMGTARQVMQWKSTKGYSAFPFAAASLQMIMWVLYSAPLPGRIQSVVTNLIGASLMYAYLVVFTVNAAPGTRATMLAQAVGVPALVAVLLAIAIFVGTDSDPTCAGSADPQGCMEDLRGQFTIFALPDSVPYGAIAVFGKMLLVLNIVFYASPLIAVKEVFKTRSVEFMPLGFSTILTLNATAWFSFGTALQDPTIWVPNLCGILLGMLQIGIWIAFRHASPAEAREKLVSIDETGRPLAAYPEEVIV